MPSLKFVAPWWRYLNKHTRFDRVQVQNLKIYINGGHLFEKKTPV